MRYKRLFTILTILIILLFYNMFCLFLVNRNVKNLTKYALDGYFTEEVKYEYVMATSNSDDSINVFIKADKKYYRFVMSNNGSFYTVKDVNNDIPAYILNK